MLTGTAFLIFVAHASSTSIKPTVIESTSNKNLTIFFAAGKLI